MIQIETVSHKRDLKAFINFPASIFKHDAHWIPPLSLERFAHFSVKNPASEHIEWRAWVAKKGGKVVGRISAQVDTLHRERYGEETGHFGALDAIDDPDVFSSLFSAAENWLISKGTKNITGPFSMNINQESGLLIEGFDTPPSTMMVHGKPYYATRVEQQGYKQGIDLLAYWIRSTELLFPPSLLKLMTQVRKKVTIRCLNRRKFMQEMQTLRQIFNSAWQNNWGFVPFTEHEFSVMSEQLKFIVPDDMIYIADVDSVPAAFIIGLPNINEAIADLNGSLLPVGWIKLLWRLKVSGVRTARVPLMGVKMEYQFSRIGPVLALLLIEALHTSINKHHIDGVEMSWILESNAGMRNILDKIGAVAYKRYRLYEKQL